MMNQWGSYTMQTMAIKNEQLKNQVKQCKPIPAMMNQWGKRNNKTMPNNDEQVKHEMK